MLRNISLVSVLMLLAAVPAAGAAQQDTQIVRDIQREVRGYTHYTVFDDISADINEGVVRLTGSVTQPFKKEDIGESVAEIPGVVEVQNDIEVLPVSTFDDELRLRIARAIYGNSAFWHYATRPDPSIHIVVKGGRVTLTGVVDSEVDRQLAQSLAWQFGAFSVENTLRTTQEARKET
jgi:hyperosmotically inducible protein